MKFRAVLVAVFLATVVSVDASIEMTADTSPRKLILNDGLASSNAAAQCRCPIPQNCNTGNTCECLNNAAVSCWLESLQSCQLSLQNCEIPNSPPASSNSQFPPCLANGAVASNPLPPCAATATCRKLDSSCYDWNRSSSGGCIGICVPKSFGQRPKQTPSPKQVPLSKQTGPQWQGGSWLGSQPTLGPQQTAPQGTQAVPLGPQWTPPPWTPNPQNGGQQNGGQPNVGQQNGGPPSFGTCPANIKCPGNNVCIGDPRNKSTFICLQPNEFCGTFQNITCQTNKMCVADPRIQCKGQGCSGLCV